MQREPIIFCEPAELSLGEEWPEGFTHAVSVPVERPAYERSEDVPMPGGYERRAALREHLRARLPTEADGAIRLTARAWTVRGIR